MAVRGDTLDSGTIMMGTRQWVMLSVTMVLALARYDSTLGQDSSAKKGQLTIAWADNFLSVRGDDLPGGLVRTNYLEAYCRPGSTDRDWGQTVIGHRTELTSVSDDARVIQLRDTLNDGVIVTHTITAGTDEIDFRLVAHNPTNSASLTHWAQPCMRVRGGRQRRFEMPSSCWGRSVSVMGQPYSTTRVSWTW